jgi:hypothetical protein
MLNKNSNVKRYTIRRVYNAYDLKSVVKSNTDGFSNVILQLVQSEELDDYNVIDYVAKSVTITNGQVTHGSLGTQVTDSYDDSYDHLYNDNIRRSGLSWQDFYADKQRRIAHH